MQETVKFLNGELRGRSYNKLVFSPNRMGDVLATMIHAEYKKKVHGCYIQMVLESDLHKRMKIDVLFKDIVDEWLPKHDGILHNVYSPDPLWVSTQTLFNKFGLDVLPNINLDKTIYTGPELPDEYIIFSPIFDCDYIPGKNMNIDMVNTICDKLYNKFGNKFLLTTNFPNNIRNTKINTMISNNLYNIIYAICKSKSIICGETGFSLFAGISEVPQILQLKYVGGEDFKFTYGHAWPEDFIHPFGIQGQYIGQMYTAGPYYDSSKVSLKQWWMRDNLLSNKDIDNLIDSVEL